MSNTITESGMDFIADNAFRIEKNPQYLKIKRTGVRSVEFVRIIGEKLVFLEAKTTFPNPANKERFEEEIGIILNKFIHSLNFYSSISVGVAEEQFPNCFHLKEKMSLQFHLVIKEHKSEWCRPIRREIMQALPTYIKVIWKPVVYVMNHDDAVENHITLPT